MTQGDDMIANTKTEQSLYVIVGYLLARWDAEAHVRRRCNEAAQLLIKSSDPTKAIEVLQEDIDAVADLVDDLLAGGAADAEDAENRQLTEQLNFWMKALLKIKRNRTRADISEWLHRMSQGLRDTGHEHALGFGIANNAFAGGNYRMARDLIMLYAQDPQIAPVSDAWLEALQ